MESFDWMITKFLCGLFWLSKTARKCHLLKLLYSEQAFCNRVAARFLVTFNHPTPEELSVLWANTRERIFCFDWLKKKGRKERQPKIFCIDSYYLLLIKAIFHFLHIFDEASAYNSFLCPSHRFAQFITFHLKFSDW